MALKAENKSPKSVSAPQGGTHMARLVGITDLGHQPGFSYKGNDIASQWKVEFTYELVNSHMEDGRPHWVSEEVKINDFIGKGIISTMMARIKTMAPDQLEEAKNDLTILLNKPCMVTVTINDKGYPQLKGQAAVSGIPMGMSVPELQNEAFAFDMDEPDMELFYSFPEFKQEKMKKALNFDETQLARELAADDKY